MGTLTVAKIYDGEEKFVEVLRQSDVKFDARPGWLLFAQPIGSIHRTEIFWRHPDDIIVLWMRDFLKA